MTTAGVMGGPGDAVTVKLRRPGSWRVQRTVSLLQVQLERVRDELTLQNFTLKSKLSEFTQQLSSSGVQFRLDQQPPSGGRVTLDSSSLTTNLSSGSVDEDGGPSPDARRSGGSGGIDRRGTYKVTSPDAAELRRLNNRVSELTERDAEQQRRIAELETHLNNQRNQVEQLRTLESRLEESLRRCELSEQLLATKQEEHAMLKLDLDVLQAENTRLKDDLSRVLRQEAEHSSRLLRLGDCETELGRLQEERRSLSDTLQHERLLRKQYFNQMEELKGRIRVFCRLRPLSETERRRGGPAAIDSADPYTLCVDGDKGQREFQFDRVFTEDTGQQRIFDEVEVRLCRALGAICVTMPVVHDKSLWIFALLIVFCLNKKKICIALDFTQEKGDVVLF